MTNHLCNLKESVLKKTRTSPQKMNNVFDELDLRYSSRSEKLNTKTFTQLDLLDMETITHLGPKLSEIKLKKWIT